MVDDRDPSIEALLRAVREEYARALPSKSAHLEALVRAEAWGDARSAAHKLRGSAGVHGFVAVGAVAGELEDLLSAADPPDAARRSAVDRAVSALRAEAEAAVLAGSGTPS